MAFVTRSGTAQPLGASLKAAGVNFSLFSKNVTQVALLLFDRPDDPRPSQIIEIQQPTQYYWHVQVDGALLGTCYAYRVSCPSGDTVTQTLGYRFNPSKVLIDPYSRANANTLWVAAAAKDASDNVATAMRSVVVDADRYDWQGDAPPNTSMRDSVIYELHVRGYTRSPSSGVAHPGTFSGLVEKLPYIKSLGVTAIELMPVFDFDGKTVKRTDPTTGAPLVNFWGYDPIGFFALQSIYSASADAAAAVNEFRALVKRRIVWDLR